MNIHIGITTWNRLDLTRRCLESLLATTPAGYTLTIVDNASNDGTPDYLRAFASQHSHIRLKLLSRNMGVSVASNMAWDDAPENSFFIKLDNDMELLRPAWQERLLAVLSQYPDVGVVSYRLCEWHRLSSERLPLTCGGEATRTTSCCGACACISPRAHEVLGFWNEGYGRYGYEDVEYAWRAHKAGVGVAYLEAEDLIRHLGYVEGMVNTDIEDAKQENIAAKLTGKLSFHCHTMLYDEGILPVNMTRKYLVTESPAGKYAFSLNPAYRPIMKLLQRMAGTMSVDTSGSQPQLDLSAWRSTPGETQENEKGAQS